MKVQNKRILWDFDIKEVENNYVTTLINVKSSRKKLDSLDEFYTRLKNYKISPNTENVNGVYGLGVNCDELEILLSKELSFEPFHYLPEYESVELRVPQAKSCRRDIQAKIKEYAESLKKTKSHEDYFKLLKYINELKSIIRQEYTKLYKKALNLKGALRSFIFKTIRSHPCNFRKATFSNYTKFRKR